MLLLLLVSVAFSVAMVWINYNRLFAKYSSTDCTDCSKCTKVCVDNGLDAGQLRQNSGVAEGGSKERQSNIKHDVYSNEKHTVFNFGQFLRGGENQNEKNDVNN